MPLPNRRTTLKAISERDQGRGLDTSSLRNRPVTPSEKSIITSVGRKAKATAAAIAPAGQARLR